MSIRTPKTAAEEAAENAIRSAAWKTRQLLDEAKREGRKEACVAIGNRCELLIVEALGVLGIDVGAVDLTPFHSCGLYGPAHDQDRPGSRLDGYAGPLCHCIRLYLIGRAVGLFSALQLSIELEPPHREGEPW